MLDLPSSRQRSRSKYGHASSKIHANSALGESLRMSPVDNEQFRLEDYRLKVASLERHSDRMWTRFNYFITIEAGLVGLFFVVSGDDLRTLATWAALAESGISLVWWLVGARDRFLWKANRANVVWAAERLEVDGKELAVYGKGGVYKDGDYIPVGELDYFAAKMLSDARHRHVSIGALRVRLGGWAGSQDSSIGVTFIPMAVPLVATILWWYAFVILLALEEPSVFFVLGSVPILLAALRWSIPGRAERAGRPKEKTTGKPGFMQSRAAWIGRAVILLALVVLAGCVAIVISAAINPNGANRALASVLLTLTGVLVVLGIVALLFHLVSRRVALASAAAILAASLTVGLTVKPTLELGGPRGPRGYSAHNGRNGTNGTNGTNGANGHNGRNGHNGHNGAKGKEGKTGPRGPRGERGLPGPPPEGS